MPQYGLWSPGGASVRPLVTKWRLSLTVAHQVRPSAAAVRLLVTRRRLSTAAGRQAAPQCGRWSPGGASVPQSPRLLPLGLQLTSPVATSLVRLQRRQGGAAATVEDPRMTEDVERGAATSLVHHDHQADEGLCLYNHADILITKSSQNCIFLSDDANRSLAVNQ